MLLQPGNWLNETEEEECSLMSYGSLLSCVTVYLYCTVPIIYLVFANYIWVF